MMSTPQHNQQVATIFRSIAERLAAQRANPYRVRAYRKAADAIEALEEDIADVASRQALEDIDGIGRDLADKIEEFLRTGTIQAYEALRTPLPEAVKAWAQLPGLSESLVAYLYTRLCITTLTDWNSWCDHTCCAPYQGSQDRKNACWRPSPPYNGSPPLLRRARKLLKDLPGLQHLDRLLELHILLKRGITRDINGRKLRHGAVLRSALFLSFAILSRLIFPWHDRRLGLL